MEFYAELKQHLANIQSSGKLKWLEKVNAALHVTLIDFI
jgi:hypothetical protein